MTKKHEELTLKTFELGVSLWLVVKRCPPKALSTLLDSWGCNHHQWNISVKFTTSWGCNYSHWWNTSVKFSTSWGCDHHHWYTSITVKFTTSWGCDHRHWYTSSVKVRAAEFTISQTLKYTPGELHWQSRASTHMKFNRTKYLLQTEKCWKTRTDFSKKKGNNKHINMQNNAKKRKEKKKEVMSPTTALPPRRKSPI